MGTGQFLSVDDWKDFSEAERRVLNLMRDHLPHGQDEINEAAGGSGRPHSEGKRRLRALRPKLNKRGWCIDCDREAGRSFVYRLQVQKWCGHCKRSDEIDDSTSLGADGISVREITELLKVPRLLIDRGFAKSWAFELLHEEAEEHDGETYYDRTKLFEAIGFLIDSHLTRNLSYAKSVE